MTHTAISEKSVNARTLLLPYALVMIGSMAIIQVVIALNGGEITLLAGILTAAVALGIAIWVFLNFRSLTKVRFGLAIAHAIAFATVTTSFNAHAFIRALELRLDGLDAVAEVLLSTPWFGATLVMSAMWGVGLVVHLVGVVIGRGWEN